MFVILTYDANAKRTKRLLKICRKYLTHEQKSVFEGFITEAKLKRLKKELSRAIDREYDSIKIYVLDSLKYVRKEELGLSKKQENVL